MKPDKLVAIIAGLFAPASVASVMSSSTKTIAKLDKVAAQHSALIRRKSALISDLNDQIDAHDAEVDAAVVAAGRLRSLVQ